MATPSPVRGLASGWGLLSRAGRLASSAPARETSVGSLEARLRSRALVDM